MVKTRAAEVEISRSYISQNSAQVSVSLLCLSNSKPTDCNTSFLWKTWSLPARVKIISYPTLSIKNQETKALWWLFISAKFNQNHYFPPNVTKCFERFNPSVAISHCKIPYIHIYIYIMLSLLLLKSSTLSQVVLAPSLTLATSWLAKLALMLATWPSFTSLSLGAAFWAE